MQLDPRQILSGLRKRWWLALIVTLVAAAVAYIYTNMQPRIYQAQTTIAAKSVPPDNGTIEAIKKTMPTYAQDLGNKQSWSRALDNAGVQDVFHDALPNQIKIQPLPDQNSIVMTVDNQDATKAAIVAETIANDFVDRQNAENQATSAGGFRVVWTVTQPAEPPSQPYQPRPLLYTAAAALFGLVLGLLLAIALELLDTTLKNSDEVQQYTGLNTLGVIPKS
ncbi:MAG: protein tyrosine kinase modulator [Chloroflexia bacterium]|jgi:capsular polysaccharide biosynthesis protein|nr:protein tyrosine kinase modulator [Chloroflexia bacterium]